MPEQSTVKNDQATAKGENLNSNAKTNNADNQVLTLLDFESSSLPDVVVVENGLAKPIHKTQNQAGVTSGNQALSIQFLAKENYKSSISFKPKTPWDWSELGDFSLAMDISNPLDESTHIFGQVFDKKGQTHTRSVVIPKRSSNTYYIELKGHDLTLETGIRSNPPSWQSDDQQFIWRWGTKQLDVSAISAVKLSVTSLLNDKPLIIDNLRLIKNPPVDGNYLANLVDEFGQSTRTDFKQKIDSLAELNQVSQQELASLDGQLMPDRSKFGGWKTGPKLQATGFFRTEKIGDTWTLVDPEGYLFFSHGIANVRMANTSTMTGVDFKRGIVARAADDVTPEDSKGLNGVSVEAQQSAYVSSALRRDMFSWLPSYDDPLARHYGYRREVHSGALDKGETYSFYQANLQRKYGDNFIEQWRDVTVDRMINWGFTSFGNWIDPMFYHLDRFAYFANGWIIGDFKKVSSGADYWSPLPDPFDPVFRERAAATVAVIADEVKQNPWCIGIFIDNEKSWGMTGSHEGRYGVVIHTLGRSSQDSPTKAVFSQLMKDKYGDIRQLSEAWQQPITSWQAFDAGIATQDFTPAQLQDFALLLETYAAEYFKIVKQEVKKKLPNHLYMGARFADWGMTPEIVSAAAKHVDVMSYNFYKEGLHAKHWQFLKDVDMPSIIGEFHVGATDTGLLNPGLVHAQSQQDRANMYSDYMNTVIPNDYFVGAHWFQYTDSPLTGRAYDGENYNVGFVSVTDTPYQEIVEATKSIMRDIYPNKYGHLVAK
ncbi:agarase [Saccharobesus litoralis]|uniref:Agarase n=1 Tax=Saccharobesus litoralis TaxID=2172099 RepID=A0A2S0VXK6_9ALTE|nr:agarase [Saccharobesus litoralis]